MPFEITNQGDFLLVRFDGVITAEELGQFAAAAESVEDSTPRQWIGSRILPPLNALTLASPLYRFSQLGGARQ